MKKICCMGLVLLTVFGNFSSSLCYASNKRGKISYSKSRKINKNKKKPEYRQKKELDMFVRYLIAKEDKIRRNETEENIVEICDKVEESI